MIMRALVLFTVVSLIGVAGMVGAEESVRIGIVGLPNDAHLAAAAIVFSGRAVAQEFVVRHSGQGHDTRTAFDVERQWKGQSRTRIDVLTCGGDGTVICGETFTFRVGERYLVFASGDALSTNSCTLTGLFERSSAVMAWLDRVVPNRAR